MYISFQATDKHLWSTSQGIILFSVGDAKMNRILSCSRLNVHVPNKFTCWNPNPNGDSIRRRELWEVTGSWGQSPHEWNYCFIIETLQSFLSFLPCEDRATRHHPWARYINRYQICRHFDLRPPSPPTVRNKFLLEIPSLWYFGYSSSKGLTQISVLK